MHTPHRGPRALIFVLLLAAMTFTSGCVWPFESEDDEIEPHIVVVFRRALSAQELWWFMDEFGLIVYADRYIPHSWIFVMNHDVLDSSVTAEDIVDRILATHADIVERASVSRGVIVLEKSANRES